MDHSRLRRQDSVLCLSTDCASSNATHSSHSPRSPPPPSDRSIVLHAVRTFAMNETSIATGMHADIHLRSTFPRPDEPTARARTARSTPSTRSPVSRPDYPSIRAHTESLQSTRQERLRCSLRESVVMIASSPVTEVRLSPSSTRYDYCTPLLLTSTDPENRGRRPLRRSFSV
jgi:hypothetical protein